MFRLFGRARCLPRPACGTEIPPRAAEVPRLARIWGAHAPRGEPSFGPGGCVRRGPAAAAPHTMAHIKDPRRVIHALFTPQPPVPQHAGSTNHSSTSFIIPHSYQTRLDIGGIPTPKNKKSCFDVESRLFARLKLLKFLQDESLCYLAKICDYAWTDPFQSIGGRLRPIQNQKRGQHHCELAGVFGGC